MRVRERVQQNSETDANVQAAEEETEHGKFDFLLTDDVWCNAICQRFGLTSKTKLEECLNIFALDLICRGKEEHSSIQDLKCHFFDWMKFNAGKRMEKEDRFPTVSAEMALGDRYKEEQLKPTSSVSAQDEATRRRLLGIIEVLKKNPQSYSRALLINCYESGELARLGIEWKP